MMMKIAASLLVLASAADAFTRVAVVELGVGGTVRRTSSKSSESTVEGVNSFVQLMHGGRQLQHAGMPVVPDLFQKADGGVVLGLSGQGVDVAEMPAVAALLEEEKDGVVGHLSTNGKHCNSIVSRATSVEEVSEEELPVAMEKASKKQSLSGVKMTVKDTAAASSVDKEVADLIRDLHKKTKEQGKTVVLYLVVEEESSVSRRRLADQQQDGQNQAGKYVFFTKSGNQNGGDNNGGNNDNNPYAQMFAGYYGFGYYNSYGEWVTPYKSMFQIQYFNVVLWTAIGLAVILGWVIMMMMYMPLEPDTLLFGESAKMIGDD
uniref:Uncharacterized protein n=1 Tax=Entomoneis paludosa TaxID=265537 RepID=A0A7S2YB49_9STRA|eukprot:CAMPEP_0172456638 /NCGR_PEP_ID=MMETSP1065-20121228/16859_1 /TAXON_ID=265537 /ORGANISM="Amphiprora paludosa, Strain CCMP125" /LENGTH=318 /DNA_ID=CAMNT_0013209799 /DNA_START=54 /DNA_END=1010 /DNA_ORIENTATION=-